MVCLCVCVCGGVDDVISVLGYIGTIGRIA